MGNDIELLANNIMMDLAFLTMSWKHMLGRPTYTIIASSDFVGKVNVYNVYRNIYIIRCKLFFKTNFLFIIDIL